MQLNYYLNDNLRQVEIHQPCPGCGEVEKLAMHSLQISWMHDRTEWYVGCSCGWRGPGMPTPPAAAQEWDMRSLQIGVMG